MCSRSTMKEIVKSLLCSAEIQFSPWIPTWVFVQELKEHVSLCTGITSRRLLKCSKSIRASVFCAFTCPIFNRLPPTWRIEWNKLAAEGHFQLSHSSSGAFLLPKYPEKSMILVSNWYLRWRRLNRKKAEDFYDHFNVIDLFPLRFLGFGEN